MTIISRNNNWTGKKRCSRLWPFKTMINRISDQYYTSLSYSLIADSCAHVSSFAFHVVSETAESAGRRGSAAAAKSRAVQYSRLRSATPQRPYWPDTSTWPHAAFRRSRIGTFLEGYLLMLLLKPDLPLSFFFEVRLFWCANRLST